MTTNTTRRSESGAVTMRTVLITLTLLGVAGVIVVGIALAAAGITGIGLVILLLFGMQAFYGILLYRRLERTAPPQRAGSPEGEGEGEG